MNVLWDKLLEKHAQSLGMTIKEINNQILIGPQSLHDPFLYEDMDKLVTELHRAKKLQESDNDAIVVIDTDYDADGIASAAVISASLSLFGIRHKVYAPSMRDGYGLTPPVVDRMVEFFGKTKKITHLITADNGTNAVTGIERAHQYGVTTLVTDHHLSDDSVAKPYALVNPKLSKTYPFTGNAGATVAWKTMLAYAMKYQPESYKFIYQLIVFAGIANVADVMPILDENRFMVKESLRIIKQGFEPSVDSHYNNVMGSVNELIETITAAKKEKAQRDNKRFYPLTQDESLIGFYIAPHLNAPRRLLSESLPAMKALLLTNNQERQNAQKDLIDMRQQVAELKAEAVKEQLGKIKDTDKVNVLLSSSTHGIVGLVASDILGRTAKPTIVFSKSENALRISSSARSIKDIPLPWLIGELKKRGFDIQGGGHAQAAGYSILPETLDNMRQQLNDIAKDVIVRPPTSDDVFCLSTGTAKGDVYTNSIYDLENELQIAYQNIQNMKPFGQQFEEPVIVLRTTGNELASHFDAGFWGGRTFKARIGNIILLTWNQDLARQVKDAVHERRKDVINLIINLKINSFDNSVQMEAKAIIPELIDN